MSFDTYEKLIKTILKTYSKMLAKEVFCRNSSRNSFFNNSIMLETFKTGCKNTKIKGDLELKTGSMLIFY